MPIDFKYCRSVASVSSLQTNAMLRCLLMSWLRRILRVAFTSRIWWCMMHFFWGNYGGQKPAWTHLLILKFKREYIQREGQRKRGKHQIKTTMLHLAGTTWFPNQLRIVCSLPWGSDWPKGRYLRPHIGGRIPEIALHDWKLLHSSFFFKGSRE